MKKTISPSIAPITIDFDVRIHITDEYLVVELYDDAEYITLSSNSISLVELGVAIDAAMSRKMEEECEI